MNAELLQDKRAFQKVAPPCGYFGTCGGCSLQDVAYADQLTLKRQRLLRCLRELDPSVDVDIVGADDPWRYRNKAELSFGQLGRSGADGVMLLGYHAAGSFWKVVDLNDCLLLPKPMVALARDVWGLANTTGLPAYQPRTRQGFFRHLVVRFSQAAGKALICVVTTRGERGVIERLAGALMARHPELAGVYWGVNEKPSDIAAPDELVLIQGEPYLQDRIGPFTVQCHPFTFVQPSPVQAERLYATLREWVSPSPEGIAWDLYCGVGVVGLYLASKFRTVYGIDIDPRNMEMARANAAANGIANMQFQTGPAEDLLQNKRFWLQDAKPDVVVVDPPRSGLHERVIASLLAARPKELAYISCNAQAMVQDLKRLRTGFPRYRIRAVRAFDLFPHTPHLEVLAVLERNG